MRRLASAFGLTAVLAAAGCGGSTTATPQPGGNQTAAGSPGAAAGAAAKAGTFGDWPTYHRTASRSGLAPTPVKPPLHTRWTKHLDGAVYGEAIVAHGLLIAATENDTVYGLNPKTGSVKWHKHLGTPAPQSTLPCGDIDPLGITGTPSYDAKTGSVFVVAETTGGHHTLWALRATTGGRRWHRSLDVEHSRDIKAEQERSALLVTDHRVITTFGGLDGDCGNYVGYVTSVSTSGHGKTTSYAVPTSREAGMWSPAGPVRGHNGNVYVASGNGAELHGKWDKSDSVTELTPAGLHRKGVFAPSTWQVDNQQDLDLGSSSPVPVNGRIVIAGKRGTVYLVKSSLGGIGHGIDTVSGCRAFGGPARSGHTVLMPCVGFQGETDAVRALRVGHSSLHWAWTAKGIYGSPIIAGHRVYVADRDSGDLVVLSLTTGHVLAKHHIGAFTHFPSVTVDGGRVFVPTLSGVTAVAGS
jgi:outer membrane protein assembly factor BamB